MGKISTGCDIVFLINGDENNLVKMGSGFASNQVNLENIATILMKDKDTREKLKEALKMLTDTRRLSEEDFEREGIVNNGTVYNLAQKYPDFDWDKVDQSTKILATDRFVYYNDDLSNKIIKQNGEQIIVINIDDIDHVRQLYDFLTKRNKLVNLTEETNKIISNSIATKILKKWNRVINDLKSKKDRYSELDKIETKTNKQKKEFEKLKVYLQNHERLLDVNFRNEVDLLLDFLENSKSYFGISYVVDGRNHSIDTDLKNLLKEVEGKQVRPHRFDDAFSEEIYQRLSYVSVKNEKGNYELFGKISKDDFIVSLERELQYLQTESDKLKNESVEYKKMKEIRNKIQKFLELKNKDASHCKSVLDELIEYIPEEFSYSLHHMDKNNIYLNNVPETLEERYKDFSSETINVFKLKETYKGYEIYYDPNGKGYYYSRHKLTTKSYGKKHDSVEECKRNIDGYNTHDPLNKSGFIEFKTRQGDIIYSPNKFIVGQVVKSLDFTFDPKQELNAVEEDLLYNTGYLNSNNLSRFYNYVLGDSINGGLIKGKYYNSYKDELPKVIDTAEKAACFIYLLNEKIGTERNSKVPIKVFEEILEEIKKAKYKYYSIEYVGNYSTGGKKYGYKSYSAKDSSGKDHIKGTFRTIINEIQPSEFSDLFAKTDKGTGRLASSIRLLNDLSKKIKDKLGIEIHVLTQSDLEQEFTNWKEEMPNDVKGFIKNGEIYINASNASSQDLFHEFTHIMLGVLKARNYENYYNLINLVAETDRGKKLKEYMRNNYSNLSEQDLDEEVFAEMFGLHLAGKDFGLFLNGQLASFQKAVDAKMKSIFSKEKLSEEFNYGSLENIFSQFGFDLGTLLKQTNGLELKTELKEGTNYRRASNWISQQIEKYSKAKEDMVGEELDEELQDKYADNKGVIGILEECE